MILHNTHASIIHMVSECESGTEKRASLYASKTGGLIIN
jgi:hypothetical protein